MKKSKNLFLGFGAFSLAFAGGASGTNAKLCRLERLFALEGIALTETGTAECLRVSTGIADCRFWSPRSRKLEDQGIFLLLSGRDMSPDVAFWLVCETEGCVDCAFKVDRELVDSETGGWRAGLTGGLTTSSDSSLALLRVRWCLGFSTSTNEFGRLISPDLDGTCESSTRGAAARGVYSELLVASSSDILPVGWKETGRGLAGPRFRDWTGRGGA